MHTLIPIAIAAIVLALFASTFLRKVKSRKRRNKKAATYIAKPLLSKVEKELYFRLITALPNHRVFAQVQLIRLIDIEGIADRMNWMNKIAWLSLDFVICDSQCSVIAAIELDDSTHQKPRQQYRDFKKNSALHIANIKLIRWEAHKLPSLEQIKTAIPQTA